jgi:hypothetical protein
MTAWFAAVHESLVGTNAKCRPALRACLLFGVDRKSTARSQNGAIDPEHP